MYRMGIDLGGTQIKCGLVRDGQIVRRLILPTPRKEGYDAVLAAIADAVMPVAGRESFDLVGMGVPGLIDVENGTVLYSNNFGWENKKISRDLSRMLGVPVRIANDAQAAALGEALYGAGTGCDRMAMLTLGTGVGGGFVRNGRLDTDVYGAMAYIFGHTTLAGDRALCNCGREGCAETVVSAPALVKAFFAHTGQRKTAKEILNQEDIALCPAYHEWLKALCALSVNVVNTLRPKRLIIGGGLIAAAALFIPAVNLALQQQVYGYTYAPVVALAASLGNDAGIVGGANLNTPAVS